ncbi:ATP-dependent helicase [Helicobacter felis]|uniref:ATP-dependent helicase n=1 Tax=Helicobacter felis TaxID=214 RepID=UPI000CF035BC|nr:ATP-dependent helicase [Helicobacter felis]
MQLNSEQIQATQAHLGRNLIIASAGTGKTSTIVGRIIHLLKQGISPHEILLLTFTNKASLEMKERLAIHTPHAQFIQAGTFHATAYRHLKELYPHLSLKQPRELCVLLKSVLEGMPAGEDFYSANFLYDLHSLYLNAQRPESFSDWIIARNPDQEEHAEYYEIALGLFEELKQEHHYVDYNDLLLLFRQRMQEERVGFVEVLCDEYQDTNPLQDSILDTINPPSLFCVGDYDQSIYAFNGADISIIGNFTTKHPNARVFTLKKNYRSSPAILALANKVINHNPRLYPKSLEVAKTTSLSTPQLLEFEELFLQYRGIARHIASRGNFEEVAVLFRNNSSADGCEASLRELGVPSKRRGGGYSFFDAKEVRLILDVCAFLSHPKDMMASLQILSYGHGIGNAVARELYMALQILGDGDSKKGLLHPNNKDPYPQNKQTGGLFEEFFATETAMRFKNHVPPTFNTHPLLKHPKLTATTASFLGDFFTLCQTHPLSPQENISHIYNSAWFRAIMDNLTKERAKNKDGSIDSRRQEIAAQKILRKITLLSDLAKPYKSLKEFLSAMALDAKENLNGEGVHLLSIHASKGLEFKEVYVIDLMEGRFPNTKLAKQSGSLEEERRLFYVATTRAKDHLYLSYAKKDKIKDIEYRPSCFLKEAGLIP